MTKLLSQLRISGCRPFLVWSSRDCSRQYLWSQKRTQHL
uniref:Uncharacterized protein n=1 Tax=Arundo donax TaxID=35708 RepID=A0A0A9D1H7_ARUDO